MVDRDERTVILEARFRHAPRRPSEKLDQGPPTGIAAVDPLPPTSDVPGQHSSPLGTLEKEATSDRDTGSGRSARSKEFRKGHWPMDTLTAEWLRAFLIWLPAGTLGPYIVSRWRGADPRLAIIEAGIFALSGLLLYPTLLGLLSARFIDWQRGTVPIESLFVAGFFLAGLTIVLMRRATHRLQRGSSTRRWTTFR